MKGKLWLVVTNVYTVNKTELNGNCLTEKKIKKKDILDMLTQGI
jgi:hypothetical protein